MPLIADLRGIHKQYRQGGVAVPVLRGLDLQIQAGETLAILGQSGSGKSTLLSLLAGLDRPDAGSIHVNGVALNEADERALAAFRANQLGIVFQQFHLLEHFTALENVAAPLDILHQPDSTERALKAVESVGLSERAHHFPSELSGGERQRIAIARAFVHEPALLLADEPSGNLDTRTGEAVMTLLFGLVRDKNKTLILVTHDERLAQRCSRRLWLEDGRLHTAR